MVKGCVHSPAKEIAKRSDWEEIDSSFIVLMFIENGHLILYRVLGVY